MKNYGRIALLIFCVMLLSSCDLKHRGGSNASPSAVTNVVSFTCDELKAINTILFITFTYDEQYDLDNDGAITVQDKIIIEKDLLKNGATCVVALRTCDDLQAVKDEVDTWSDAQSWIGSWATSMKAAIAYSIIFNESGERCADDFGSGSFIGDVNNNGLLDCNDPSYIQKYTVGLPLDIFEPDLADINASGGINATDALIVKIALNSLFTNYMDNLGACQ
ncbi:MAG: dockerin type I domain-containing protein [bacterium]